jgi:hypothetical protein
VDTDPKRFARALVARLLEDADAELPKHRSEVRILPTKDPQRFDVTLLTGFDPIYVGTIGVKGKLWRPVETMPGTGRQLRARLHFVGHDKESVAMAMVDILRPLWSRKIKPHLYAQMESDDDVDPKVFIKQNLGIETDIKRVIETNYPDIEVLSVTNASNEFRMDYEAEIRSKDAAKPLHHNVIYAMIKDVEVKLADVYGWKLRPYMNQRRFPEFLRTGKPVGVVPISISYDNTSTPGTFRFFISFKIMRRSLHGRGDFEEQADWNTPYGSPGEVEESSKAEIDKEADKAEKPASPEQAEAGNYRKGHVSVQGLEIAIENAKGSARSGTGKDGKPWKVTLPAHYGYIKGTQGKDKDHLDVYIGPNPGGLIAFVVNQQKEEGGFDEHKIMIGFESKDEAIATYDRAFTGDLGPKLRGSVVSTTMDKLKDWIASGNTKKPFEGLAESLVTHLLDEQR